MEAHKPTFLELFMHGQSLTGAIAFQIPAATLPKDLGWNMPVN